MTQENWVDSKRSALDFEFFRVWKGFSQGLWALPVWNIVYRNQHGQKLSITPQFISCSCSFFLSYGFLSWAVTKITHFISVKGTVQPWLEEKRWIQLEMKSQISQITVRWDLAGLLGPCCSHCRHSSSAENSICFASLQNKSWDLVFDLRLNEKE